MMKSLTKPAIWTVIALIAIITLLWWGRGERQAQVETLHIAALIPLTGNGALDGEQITRGLKFAQQQLNELPGPPVRITVEDTKGKSTEALSSYQKLRLTDPPHAIITWGSGVGLALTQVVNDDQVIQMGVATSSPDYSSPGDYTFRNFPLASDEANFIIDQLKEKFGAKRIAVAAINNDYGKGLNSQLQQRIIDNNLSLVREELLEADGTDYRSQISQLKAQQADALLLLAYSVEGAQFLRQAKELGLDVPVLASSAIFGNDIINAAGAGSENVTITNSSVAFSPPQTPEFQQWLNQYEATVGKPLEIQEISALRAYDSLFILVNALRQCNATTACAKDLLLNLRNYQGINGTITFDHNGDLVNPDFGLITVTDGRYEPAN